MKLKEKIYKIVTVALLAAYCTYSSSCASTKAAPSGGPKDTIPPAVVGMIPDSNTIGFPVEKGEIFIEFNEYVQLKDPNQNILLSPPQKRPVKARVKGKGILVEFPLPLDSACTYCLNFGNSILDNNEGNPLYGYTYSFSTGNSIDSMMLSGTVVDAVTLFPVEGATVALYLNATDSSVVNDLPNAVARTDKWGYFTVRNLKQQPYSVFAFIDANTNNKYDRGSEQIAFSDSIVVPANVMHKDSPQLQYYDPKDTVLCLMRPSDIQLYMFSEKATNQFIRDYNRFSKRGGYIKFNAADVQIDSFAIAGIDNSRIIRQSNITGDSLSFWIKGDRNLKDTLILSIKYLKTDSLSNLSPAVEKLRLVAPFEKKDDRRKSSDKQGDEKRKDLLEFELRTSADKVEQDGIVLSFKDPLIEMNTDTISFVMRTPKQIESNVDFSVARDSIYPNDYIIRPSVQFVKGNEYELIFPKATFKDVNGFTNDSIFTSISLPTDDYLSSITLEVSNVTKRYIIELISHTRETVFRKYIVNGPTELNFPYLKQGKYSIRITEDSNSNTLFDTGDVMLGKQPEKVRLFTLPNGSNIIELNERTDLLQEVDMAEIFGK